jgi:hypothetical protein
MPYTHAFVENGTGLHRTGSGLVTGREMVAEAYALHREAGSLQHLKYGLVDLSDVTEFDVTPDDMRALALAVETTARIAPAGLAVAIVAPSDYAYGHARIFEGHVKTGWKIRICRSRAEAEEWLQHRLRR